VFIGLLGDPVHRVLADGQQPLSRRGPLDLLGITHQIKQLRLTTFFEHTSILPNPSSISLREKHSDANLWMNSNLGITTPPGPKMSDP